MDAIEPIKRPGRGRPRKRPAKLHADKGYDFPRCREALRKRGIKGRIARRGKDTSERLGRHRWVVWSERSPGSRATAGSRCATRGGLTSTRHSSISAAPWSASTTSRKGFAMHS